MGKVFSSGALPPNPHWVSVVKIARVKVDLFDLVRLFSDSQNSIGSPSSVQREAMPFPNSPKKLIRSSESNKNQRPLCPAHLIMLAAYLPPERGVDEH